MLYLVIKIVGCLINKIIIELIKLQYENTKNYSFLLVE